MSSGPLRVALPLGIGDCHWACTKFRALSAMHDNRPVHAYVNRSTNHLTVGYLAMVDVIAEAYESPDAPYDVNRELPPNHQHPRWATLDGCRNWNGFDYVAVANGWLETGNRLETWWPELETEFSYKLNIPEVTIAKMAPWEDRTLLYLSGVGPNYGFHRNTWSVAHWARVIQQLNTNGVEPVLVGANTKDDKTYRDQVVAAAKDLEFCDLVGQTSLPEYCQIIRTARSWTGLNSGGGIVAAMLGTPTVMLWSDSQYPIPTVKALNLPLNTTMQTSWLSEQQRTTYRTRSFGSPELTPENVVADIVEVSVVR